MSIFDDYENHFVDCETKLGVIRFAAYQDEETYQIAAE